MFRKDHIHNQNHYNLLFQAGGLGDAISQLPALKYIFDNHSYNFYHVWVHDYMVEICKVIFKEYKNVNIRSVKKDYQKYKDHFYGRSPYIYGITNLSIHMTEHAFFTLVHKQVEDKYKNYIKLEPQIPIEDLGLEKDKFIVVTTGFTSNTREWLPESINGTVDYIIKKGYLPVFLGKGYTAARVEMSNGKEVGIKSEFKADYSRGLDLIDNTTLIEAHSIMANAKAVIGSDNGLLHLAAMSDVPIIYGFTSVIPEHRLPFRHDKMGYNCYVVKPKNLECFGCQSNMNFTVNHNFTDCFYKDYKCVKELTSHLFIEQLEKVLEPEEELTFFEQGLTAAQKSEKAYQVILSTQELNKKLKEIGVSLND